MHRSLRSRLLIGIGTTTIAGSLVAAVLIFLVLRGSLLREFDALLAAKARALATLIKQNGAELEIEFADHPMQEFARKIRPEYYEVWDETGTVVARSRRLGSVDLARPAGSLAAPGFQFTGLPDGRPGRLAAIRFLPTVEGEDLAHEVAGDDDDDDDENLDTIDFSSRRRVTLVVARETAVVDQALVRLRWLLTVVSTSVVATTLAVLVWLLHSSLRPLVEVTNQIARLNERDLDFRFPLRDVPRELGPMIARLNELLGRLDDAFQRERVFTSDVAHELRTPLAGLRSTLEVTLSRHRTSDEYVQGMRVCEAICSDMQKVVETLLALARMELSQAGSGSGQVNVEELLASSWRRFAARAGERQLNISFDGPSGVVLQADPTQVGIVLANLFDNAVEYTDHGGSVEVIWGTSASHFQLTISNSGCELAAEQVRQVFDRFWRADASRAATGVHAGLGLALCQRIIELQGGSIDAETRAGHFVVNVGFGEDRVSSLVERTDLSLEC